MSTIIRQSVHGDFDAWNLMVSDYDPDVAELNKQAWERFFSAAPYVCMLAIEDGKAVAFIHYTFHDFCFGRGKNCYISDLYVSPAYRRKGIARKLLSHVIETGKRLGWGRVYWVTEFDNPARPLYDSMGIAEFVRYHVDLDKPVEYTKAESEWITNLRKELMLSKMTHSFTFSRDEVIELLGGKFAQMTPAVPKQDDCINCGLPVDPACYCARGRKLNEQQKSE